MGWLPPSPDGIAMCQGCGVQRHTNGEDGDMKDTMIGVDLAKRVFQIHGTTMAGEVMRRFAGIELGDDHIPDETTILNFRHLLERHGLTEAILAEVSTHLADKGITLRSGTLVDATIIDAPSTTTNEAKARDPEMLSTKKGNDWYFGMKAHVGVDADSGIVHSSTPRPPRSTPFGTLLRNALSGEGH